MTRVVGRRSLLAEVAALLSSGTSIALCGPVGVGKSALLDVLEENARSQDVQVLRYTGDAEELHLPFTAVRDLLAQCPAELLERLPATIRSGLVGVAVTDELRSDLAAGLHELLATWSEERSLLVLMDDVQWLDKESSRVIGYVRRRLGTLALVATVGPGENRVDISGLHHVDVPPLDGVDMVELLCSHGLNPDVAQRLHIESGGIPALALALAGAMGQRPTVLGAPTPLPSSTERVLLERFGSQPDDVRATLATASLLHRPTLRDLERAGHVAAAEHLHQATLAGVITSYDAAIRFTPSALRAVVAGSMSATERAARHRDLADVVATAAERQRHLALADPRPAADDAREAARQAREASTSGRRELAAELYLLAADHAPHDLATERAEWLVCAAEAAAPGNHGDLVREALAEARELPLQPTQAVRLRLAIPELAGAGIALVDEVLTAALADAGDDDTLVAKVLIQRARIALGEARPRDAHLACERAVPLLERAGNTDELALGLTTLAVTRRWVGADHHAALQQALDLVGPTPTGFMHISPEYMQARFAFYDDQLDEAWTACLAMLAHVERAAGMDHVHVLRCLVEVAARTGRCREAMEYAERAARVGEEFDLDGHTSWFITALAELVGGSVARARTLAQRGVEAAEESGDTRYMIRHLIVWGQALLRTGDAQGACDAFARVRSIEKTGGFSDPTVSRWHSDAVSALVAVGRVEEAAALLARVREEVAVRNRLVTTDGVTAQLDRAEAVLLIASGATDEAAAVLERATKLAADVGLPLEVGRAHVVRAHLERRRRRAAAARTALHDALAVFTDLRAHPWVEQVQAELSPATCASPRGDDPLVERLTEAEARIARAVASGASNREIAERSFVSVKTVEATLTRIYRKLDVRSRTQLAALLVPAPPE